MKAKRKGILIGCLSTTLLLGGLGAVAYFTNGFKDTNKIREVTKTGTVVEKVVLSDDNNYFLVKDSKSELDGSKLLVVDEIQEYDIEGYENFETFIGDMNVSSKDMDKMWEKTSVREKAHSLNFSANMHIEKEEQEDSHFVEISYFDTIRVNFAIETDALVLAASWNDADEKKVGENWNYTADGTGLYTEVDVFSGKNIADSLRLSMVSLNGVKNFEAEIESIEFVRKSSAKAHDFLYIYDSANHI